MTKRLAQISRIANAQYEWWAYEPIARGAGLADAVMRDLQECRRPAAMQDDVAPEDIRRRLLA